MIASTRALATQFRPIYSSKGRWAGTMTPRKQVNEDGGEGIEKGNSESIVTFSRRPPLPPVLGSLVAISVLESLNKADNKDD
ncbi:hypothetical protein AAHA92_00624 [Salvia divinorum]|uniref:Uncharacterized protein n=1 Tax=Salvia divinorum TaxID=28513 RepID=A0ABD1IK73_SALDI